MQNNKLDLSQLKKMGMKIAKMTSGNFSDADDFAQEIALKMLEQAATHDSTRAKASTRAFETVKLDALPKLNALDYAQAFNDGNDDDVVKVDCDSDCNRYLYGEQDAIVNSLIEKEEWAAMSNREKNMIAAKADSEVSDFVVREKIKALSLRGGESDRNIRKNEQKIVEKSKTDLVGFKEIFTGKPTPKVVYLKKKAANDDDINPQNDLFGGA